MISWFKNIFSGDKEPQPLDYAAEKLIARSPNIAERVKLAQNPKTSKDILFYMAQMDTDPNVRRAVAENKTTPIQASAIIVKDKNEDVRFALAKRLMLLLPDLSLDKHSQLYTYAVDALGNLALDEVLRIRVIMSSTLKDMTDTPPSVAGQLARDLEREVAEPILKFCTALPDDDLLDILKSCPASWAVQAIAARPVVYPQISQAVIDTNDIPAGTILMENVGADISVATLKNIVEKSKKCPEWQKSVAMRKNLPPDLVKEMASFVENSVKNILLERTDFNLEITQDIAAIVKRRIDFVENNESPTERVHKLIAEGNMNDEIICDSLSVRDYEFVLCALAELLKTNREKIDGIFAMKAAKPIVALCWKAGFSMRTALRIQQEIAQIPHKELIYPKGGFDYPLSDEDIYWQLEYLGFVRKKSQ